MKSLDNIIEWPIDELDADLCMDSASQLAAMRHEIANLKSEIRVLRDMQGSSLSPANPDIQNEKDALRNFAIDMVAQLDSVLLLQPENLDREFSSFIATGRDGDLKIMAGRGRFAACLDGHPARLMGRDIFDDLMVRVVESGQILSDESYTCLFSTRGGLDCLIHIESSGPLGRLDKGLLMLIAGNAQSDFENINSNQDIVDAQKEIIQTLGDVVESRSRETANHTVRVAEYCYLLARLSGLSLQEARLLQFAAPMHDVGKIGIPDSILNKPGKLTSGEMDLIRTHTDIGFEILDKSERVILKTAALVAHQHHERWDGSGYPQGLSGGEIHIFGRIVAIADVFDALVNDRIYRMAMPIEKIVDILKDERGRHFEPRLVDIFLEHLDEFMEIQARYSDTQLNVDSDAGDALSRIR